LRGYRTEITSLQSNFHLFTLRVAFDKATAERLGIARRETPSKQLFKGRSKVVSVEKPDLAMHFM